MYMQCPLPIGKSQVHIVFLEYNSFAIKRITFWCILYVLTTTFLINAIFSIGREIFLIILANIKFQQKLHGRKQFAKLFHSIHFFIIVDSRTDKITKHKFVPYNEQEVDKSTQINIVFAFNICATRKMDQYLTSIVNPTRAATGTCCYLK